MNPASLADAIYVSRATSIYVTSLLMDTTTLTLPLVTTLTSFRGLTGPNIMMDARPILPQGWHFASHYVAPMESIN